MDADVYLIENEDEGIYCTINEDSTVDTDLEKAADVT